ncbi:hypothetical protein [Luteolibacter soli]|uniref:ABM domain-containing protein n=1 Tax=Luteolibacter soli TaxID=3135280 RepID=A0ABU9B0K6_9BACT
MSAATLMIFDPRSISLIQLNRSAFLNNDTEGACKLLEQRCPNAEIEFCEFPEHSDTPIFRMEPWIGDDQARHAAYDSLHDHVVRFLKQPRRQGDAAPVPPPDDGLWRPADPEAWKTAD